jgi:hypothetical protein
MTLKNKLESRIRGWFPQEPTIGIIKSTQINLRFDRWVGLPFSTIGALMIIFSVLSVAFGTSLISFIVDYQSHFPAEPGETIFFSVLCAGIFNLAAFPFGLCAGILMLARKNIGIAITGMFIVLSFGLATVLVPIFEGQPPQSGLYTASLMIVPSVVALCITGTKIGRQKTIITSQNELPPIHKSVFAGLSAAGGVLTVAGLIIYFSPLYPQRLIVILTLSVGVSLFVAAFLVRKKYKR